MIQAAACRVMLWCGTRVEELLSLKWQDDGSFDTNFVDMKNGKLVFRKHKTSKSDRDDEVILTDYAIDALKHLFEHDYRKRNNSDQTVFASSWSSNGRICNKTLNFFFKREVKTIYNEYEWPDHAHTLTLYNLRHSFISYLVNVKQVPLHVVAQQVKHSDIRTTMRYVDKDLTPLQQVKSAIGVQHE